MELKQFLTHKTINRLSVIVVWTQVPKKSELSQSEVILPACEAEMASK